MTIASFVNTAQQFASNNSPVILTVVGAAGVIGTAVLTGRATITATRIIDAEQEQLKHEYPNDLMVLTNKEKLGLVWRLYVPPIGVAAITVTSVICANRIGAKRAAAMATAFAVSEKAFEEYRGKVVEKLGAKKEAAARDELAQERINRNPISENNIIVTGRGLVPCYDAYSGRYFESTMETLKKAQNDIDYKVLHHDYATLNDFYNELGLPDIKYGSEIGWTTDNRIELKITTTMTDDDRPCLSVDFYTAPVRPPFRTL